ncbi:MAG: glycosyltransferase family 2 protein [Bacteroidales bacterium]
MKKVAIIILNWNGRKLLEEYLSSVLLHTDSSLAEIYVADNGSTDDSITFLQKTYPHIRLILLPENYGFAEGYNKAIKEIQEEYVLLLNSDVEVTAGWLNPLVCYLDENPQAAACQPKIRSYRQKQMFEHAGASGGFIDRWGYPFCRGRLFYILEEDCGQYDSIIPVFWATGAALLTRTSIYKESGGLDASFFAHMEEIDYCWRLNARGYEISVIPQSTVFHLGAATLQKESPRKTFLNFRNNLLMLYMNLPKWQCRRVLLARFFLDLIAATKMLFTGELHNAKAVIQAMGDFYVSRHRYRLKREVNLKYTVNRRIKTQYRGSIVIDFYLKQIKKFSQLSFKQS